MSACIFDILHYDLETRSELDLPTVGTPRYARDPSTEIILFLWAVNDEDVQVWEPLKNPIMPVRLKEYLTAKDVAKCGWNIIGFDNEMVFHKYGITIPVEMSIDGMIIAMMHNLPGSLDRAAKAVGSIELKDGAGKNYISMFSKPVPKNAKIRKTGKKYRDWITDPSDWNGFVFYGCQDVRTARDTAARLPRWNCTDFELEVLRLNCGINERGVYLDRPFVENVITALENQKAIDLAEVTLITGGIRPSQREKYLDWLRSRGVFLKDTRKDTIDNRLADVHNPLDPDVRRVMELGRGLTSSSTAKYYRALETVCDDGYLRWMIQYAGAHTLRFAGRGLQPHNFPRGEVKADKVHEFQLALRYGIPYQSSDFMKIAVASLRGVMTPPPGYMFTQADLSAIEGRGTAWVADEQWVLDEYENGTDMYLKDFCLCFGLNYEEAFERYKNGDPEAKDWRTKGKPINLAFGYAGGVNAFVAMARVYRIDLVAMANGLYEKNLLPEDLLAKSRSLFHMPKFRKNIVASGFADDMRTWVALDCVKRLWRRAHHKTVQFWHDLDTSIRLAIDNPGRPATKNRPAIPGQIYTCGRNGCLEVSVDNFLGDEWLRIKLPSGRYLSYMWPAISGRPKPKEEDAEDADQDDDDTIISFYAPMSSGVMVKKYSHAGVFTENIVQAFCRDILCEGMIAADAHPEMSVVLHVHDEIVCITKRNMVAELIEIMTRPVVWAPGLPLEAGGWYGGRYLKD